MRDGFYKNNSLGNRNLPGQVDEIVGSQVSMSGNIVTTFYRIGDETFGVSDWPQDGFLAGEQCLK